MRTEAGLLTFEKPAPTERSLNTQHAGVMTAKGVLSYLPAHDSLAQFSGLKL